MYSLLFLLLLSILAALVIGVMAWWAIGIIRSARPYAHRIIISKKRQALGLARTIQNPILRPQGTGFESVAVMNPTAVTDDDGRVHLFYRAIGDDGVSRIGYASSSDGIHFDDRLPYPAYEMAASPITFDPRRRAQYLLQTNPDLFASGNSWGGAEDPRAVRIGDRIYITFQSFEGWDSIRMAVISISLADLRAKRFNWTPPVYLSAPNTIQKNWVLFPKKLKEKFAIWNGLVFKDRSRAQVAYLDSLAAEPVPYLDSDSRFRNDELYEDVWDSRIRCAAAPPLETPAGWLLFYHANDARTPELYKIGAMLLDRDDPSKVLTRSASPVLEPDAHYEITGAKPGVVYMCGAVIKDGRIMVYYGAADNVVCVAEAPLDSFMDALLAKENVSVLFKSSPLFPVH